MNPHLEMLCWNVRGLHNPTKPKSLREFISMVRVNLACLQETKLETFDAFMVMQFIGPAFVDF